MSKNALMVTCLLFIAVLQSAAREEAPFSLTAYPAAQIPLGPGLEISGGESPYTVGAAFGIDGDYRTGGVPGLFVRGTLGYFYLPVIDGVSRDTDDLSILSLGAGTGFEFSPPGLDALAIKLYAAGGYYLGLLGSETAGNLFAKGGLELLYSLSPGFGIGAGAEYGRFFTGKSAELPNYLYEGMSVRLAGSYRIGAGQRKAQIEFIDIRIEPLYPILYGYYETNPLGSAVIRNREAGPIRDVEVSFFIPEYMSRPKVAAVISELGRGEEATVPLYALLSDTVLMVTEDGKRVNGEVRVSYTYRGNEQAGSTGGTATIQNRNALTWSDDRKAAAFVTAKDNTVLRFAKNIAGEARGTGSGALDSSFRQAVAIYEALGLYGMRYVIDPSSSYIELSENAQAQDYVQFPAQTLDYRAGDCDDLTILFAALLEAVNVETAFVTVPGHIYPAFALELTPEEAGRTFRSADDLIIIGEKVWVPVEATIMDQGFLRAWQEGARQWREHFPSGAAGFYPVREAWNTFRPVPSPLSDPGIAVPQSGLVERAYSRSMETIVQREIADRVARLEQQIVESGNNPAIVNRLGVLYARYGLYDKALARFESLSAVQREYVPALVNTANIHFLNGDYAKALSFYTRAGELSENNTGALLGIARAQYRLENFAEAERIYREVASADPELAGRFGYLGGSADGASRAASSADIGPAVWEE